MLGNTRTPIVFPLAGLKTRSPYSRLGMGPLVGAQSPLPQVKFLISGITKDSTSAIIGSCTVKLYRTIDDLVIETLTSDATTGVYSFSACSASFNYYVVAVDPTGLLVGLTVNTLVGTA